MYDFVVVGPPKVGKTTYLNTLGYTDIGKSRGLRFEIRTSAGNKMVRVEDLNKLEGRSRPDGVFILYDGSTFRGCDEIRVWRNKVRHHFGDVPCLFLGTKADIWISGVELTSEHYPISDRYSREYLSRPLVAMLRVVDDDPDLFAI